MTNRPGDLRISQTGPRVFVIERLGTFATWSTADFVEYSTLNAAKGAMLERVQAREFIPQVVCTEQDLREEFDLTYRTR